MPHAVFGATRGVARRHAAWPALDPAHLPSHVRIQAHLPCEGLPAGASATQVRQGLGIRPDPRQAQHDGAASCSERARRLALDAATEHDSSPSRGLRAGLAPATGDPGPELDLRSHSGSAHVDASAARRATSDTSASPVDRGDLQPREQPMATEQTSHSAEVRTAGRMSMAWRSWARTCVILVPVVVNGRSPSTKRRQRRRRKAKQVRPRGRAGVAVYYSHGI